MKYLIFIAVIVLSSCHKIPSRNFEFSYKVSLTPNNGEPMQVWIPVPQTNDNQKISEIKIITNLNYEIKTEKQYGNTYFYAYLKKGLSQSEDIDISFKVKRKQAGSSPIKETKTDKYIQANRLMPVGNKFDSIVQANHFSPENMNSVYNFVLNEMYYGKPKSNDKVDKYYASLPVIIKRGITKDSVVQLYNDATKNKSEYTFGNGNSDYACDISVGNCTDFHSYFISLARTMNVPSRFHIGFSIPNSKNGTIEGYHCWADFQQGNNWIPVDISEADKNLEKKDFYYGNLDDSRVEFTEGRDLILQDYTQGPVNFFIYPIVESAGNSYTYSKEFSYKEI